MFHITSTPKGFFVNRCTRQVFDPRPAPNPHFSHELFNTLLDVSSSLRTSWQNICVNASVDLGEGEGEGEGEGRGEGYEDFNGDTTNSGALDVVTALCSQVSVHLLHTTSMYFYINLHRHNLHLYLINTLIKISNCHHLLPLVRKVTVPLITCHHHLINCHGHNVHDIYPISHFTHTILILKNRFLF